ncbi:MAG: malto-oligosyltrehalose synthase, partial [Verrucomicrobia bacterium]|nr:malto-oligosyltrehalose synthase [Verrucomicrobiota bacterium]
IIEYMIKAAKEAKRHTSWTQPCEPYENGLKTFVKNILSTSEPNPFLSDFIRFQSSIAFFAKFNSLSQTLLKMTVPGVPDFFQGSELWDLRLVDPDNRRPVDFESRFDKLLKLKSGVDLNHLIESDDSGDSKLYIIWKTMNYRKAHPSLFDFGNYIPLQTGGAAGDHVCAFLRKTNNALALVAVPRLVYTLTGGKPILPIGDDVWRDTTIALPPSTSALQGYNILTHERTEIRYNDEGGSLRVADLFHSIPLAILE